MNTICESLLKFVFYSAIFAFIISLGMQYYFAKILASFVVIDCDFSCNFDFFGQVLAYLFFRLLFMLTVVVIAVFFF